jgi:hypothetical protein
LTVPVSVHSMLVEVALVSEQTLANLIPALDARPDRVLLVTSAEMAQRRLHIRQQRLLRLHGIEAEIVPDAPDADLLRIHEFAFDLLTHLRRDFPDAAIVLNATGGNKLMMLGFVEVFRGDARVIYADTQHRRIETLPPASGPAEPARPMKNLLDVPAYLRAQGFVYAGARSDRKEELDAVAGRKAAAKHLGSHAQQLAGFFGNLSRLAGAALGPNDEQLRAPKQRFDGVHSDAWSEALQALVRGGVLQWSGGAEIEFFDAAAARFCRGVWLEEYVWHIVTDARPFDARWSARGAWESGRAAENEFDVLVAHGNQLLFIECKTLRLGVEQSKDADILYKLDSLGRKARGLFGATWLVAAREPTPHMEDRAREQRVRLLRPKELPRLREHVLDWMNNSPPV